MTETQFRLLLVRLDPSSSELMNRVVPPLRQIAMFVAADRWIKKTTDNDDSRVLRNELSHLLRNGQFSFEGRGGNKTTDSGSNRLSSSARSGEQEAEGTSG